MMLSSGFMPKRFYYDGKYYDFHSDFREWLRFEGLILNGDVPEKYRSALALRLIFPHELPPIGAMRFVLWFYRCGQDITGSGGSGAAESRRSYDYGYDGEYIYAAFLEQYGIDLIDTPYLHWWRFRALFRGLHDTRLNKLMETRVTEITEDMSERRRESLTELQELYALPVSLAERRRIEQSQLFLGGDYSG